MDRKDFIESSFILAGVTALFGFIKNENNSISKALKQFSQTNNWEVLVNQFCIDRSIIYMNNGTMGINPKIVLEELENQYKKLATTGMYPGLKEASMLKDALSKLIGVESKTIAITKNVTEGINIACWGNELKQGDEVIMTTHEHIGGCAAWLYRAKKEGIIIKTFPLAMTAEETFNNLKKTVTPKTKIIAVPHIPCTIGQILPIKQICDYAREKNIISIVDGAHPLGMIRLNISELGCDYYSGCLHKWLLGPIGLGFVYINPSKLEQTRIYSLGAYGVPKFTMLGESLKLEDLVGESQRFSVGTFASPAYLAAVKAIDWYEKIGIDKIESRIKQLSLYTQIGLSQFGNMIEILSPIEDISRGAQTTFRFKDKKAHEFIGYAKTSEGKFVLRHVNEADIDAVRVSTHYYNSEEQIDKLMKTIKTYLAT